MIGLATVTSTCGKAVCAKAAVPQEMREATVAFLIADVLAIMATVVVAFWISSGPH